jgi:hypothetical protein
MISYEPIYGAYTELFAGLSSDITIEQSGAWSRIPIFLAYERFESTKNMYSHPMGSNCAHSKGLRAVSENYCRGWDGSWREILAMERGTSQTLLIDNSVDSAQLKWVHCVRFELGSI